MAKSRKKPGVTQKNDVSHIGNKRSMARRAKRNSSKRNRQFLDKNLKERIDG